MKQKNLTYSDKLKDPRWQKKRLEILERDKWMCQDCGDNENTLHVHHRVYMYGKEPWDTPNEYLITLCAGCHEAEAESMSEALHDMNQEIKKKFLASDVINLFNAFHDLEPYHCAEIFSTVIRHWFSSPELVKEMYDRYFEYLTNKEDNPF